MHRTTFVLSTLAAAALAKVQVLSPSYTGPGDEIAVVWIGGAHYKSSDYMGTAVTFQQQAAA